MRTLTLRKSFVSLCLGTTLWVVGAVCFAAASYCVPFFVMNEALQTPPPGITTDGTWGLRMLICLVAAGVLALASAVLMRPFAYRPDDCAPQPVRRRGLRTTQD